MPAATVRFRRKATCQMLQTNGLPGSFPIFSRDGKSLFYLKSESPGAPTELWRTDMASEKSEKDAARDFHAGVRRLR